MESQDKNVNSFGNEQHETLITPPGKPAFNYDITFPDPQLNKDLFHILQFIQEKERRRIAEGLHNDIGQLLYSAQLALSKLEDEDLNQKSHLIKKEIENLLSKSIESLRKVSFEIMPPILKDYGLKPAVEALCKKANNDKLKIHYSLNIEKRYNEELEIGLFRIIQELLNNIIKHAQASSANICIKENNSSLDLEIKDDGIGFLFDTNNGFGLSYVKQRIYYLNGQINFHSTPLKGTKVNIKILLQ